MKKKEKKSKREKYLERKLPYSSSSSVQEIIQKMDGGGWMKRKSRQLFSSIYPSIHSSVWNRDVSQVSPGKGKTKKEEYLLFTFTYLPRADSKVTAAKRKDGAMRVQREREREREKPFFLLAICRQNEK